MPVKAASVATREGFSTASSSHNWASRWAVWPGAAEAAHGRVCIKHSERKIQSSSKSHDWASNTCTAQCTFPSRRGHGLWLCLCFSPTIGYQRLWHSAWLLLSGLCPKASAWKGDERHELSHLGVATVSLHVTSVLASSKTATSLLPNTRPALGGWRGKVPTGVTAPVWKRRLRDPQLLIRPPVSANSLRPSGTV